MTETLTVPGATIAVMALVGAFGFAAPIALAVVLKMRMKVRWRFFFLGAVTFFLFATVLEAAVHRVILGGALGGVIQGNIWLYALYGGLMAGIFEESGRFLAFRLTKKQLTSPRDALMYGAGHGGIEMVLVTGVTMLNQVLLAVTLNQGGLAGVKALMGEIPPQGLAILQTMASAPSGLYLWSAFERVSAVVLHISLSVLVYAAVTKKGKGWCFPAAIALHTALNMVAVVLNSFCPMAVTELAILAAAILAALLARRIYRQLEKEENLSETP